MQMIIAYFRPRMRDAVVDRLRRLKVPGASLSTVEGFGHEAGPGGTRTYDEAVSPYVKKVKLEIVCEDDRTAGATGRSSCFPCTMRSTSARAAPVRLPSNRSRGCPPYAPPRFTIIDNQHREV